MLPFLVPGGVPDHHDHNHNHNHNLYHLDIAHSDTTQHPSVSFSLPSARTRLARQTTDDRRQTTDDRRQTTDDRRQTTDDRQRPKATTRSSARLPVVDVRSNSPFPCRPASRLVSAKAPEAMPAADAPVEQSSKKKVSHVGSGHGHPRLYPPPGWVTRKGDIASTGTMDTTTTTETLRSPHKLDLSYEYQGATHHKGNARPAYSMAARQMGGLLSFQVPGQTAAAIQQGKGGGWTARHLSRPGPRKNREKRGTKTKNEGGDQRGTRRMKGEEHLPRTRRSQERKPNDEKWEPLDSPKASRLSLLPLFLSIHPSSFPSLLFSSSLP
ncbi:hypothetical protein MAPG_10770 [Magnaporthiopsis poae ATCC 64411]|uniref:Uncharacterized protein n=1 Tax=Magnaporthiopsis poae (strain ATCC 64411 / 73-15) TaxID=644358 RepID=A0A0C4EDH1_MAGP6|nr:hypothetical protein MAPG_10770 [Magnaporthiopsis poae ATCC 64411]